MPFSKASRGTAHLFIMDPLRRRLDERSGALADLLATHPPIERRIALLYRMAGIAQPIEDRSTIQGSNVQRVQ
jgi:Zn-dependent protease with chaperone function